MWLTDGWNRCILKIRNGYFEKNCITDNEMARKDLKHQNTAYYITEWLFLNLINSRKGERKVWQEKN